MEKKIDTTKPENQHDHSSHITELPRRISNGLYFPNPNTGGMTAEQFTYWLQGFFELSDAKELEPHQVSVIKEHLALVFNKVTPSYAKPYHSGVTFPYPPTATAAASPTPGSTVQLVC